MITKVNYLEWKINHLPKDEVLSIHQEMINIKNNASLMRADLHSKFEKDLRKIDDEEFRKIGKVIDARILCEPIDYNEIHKRFCWILIILMNQIAYFTAYTILAIAAPNIFIWTGFICLWTAFICYAYSKSLDEIETN